MLGGLLGLFTTVAFVLVGAVAAVFLALYLAANPEPVVGWMVRLFPPDHRGRVVDIFSESRAKLLSWLLGRLISMAIIAVLSTVALYLIGIPGPFILGLFAGLVGFVPYVGPIISVVPRADVAATQALVEGLCVWTPATSLGGVESLVERRRRHHDEPDTVPDTLLRLSVGIENVDDLWEDLKAGLDELVDR